MKKQLSRHRLQGFTLIELMITVVIIGIIAAIALPSYSNQVTKSRRADAYACLLDAAQRQEAFYYQNNVYTVTLTDLGYAAGTVNCGDDANYTLTSAAGANGAIASSYLLTATRANAQAGDSLCGDLTLSSIGVKGESGTLDAQACW